MLNSPRWRSGGSRSSGIRLDPPRMQPEFRLLALCSSWPAQASELEPVTAPPDIDWEYLVRLARRHRIAGLLYAGLKPTAAAPPPDVAAALESEANRIAVDELWSAAETLRLQRRLRAGGVELLVLKGVAVAMLAFGRLGLRFNRDIDILVRPEDVAASLAILAAEGYRVSEPLDGDAEGPTPQWLALHKDIVLEHESGRGIVELHWRLFDNAQLLGASDLAGQTVKLTGNGVVETLPQEINLIYLCVHGAEHAWSRLKWLLDIHALATRMSSAALTELYASARARNVHRAVAQALLLCSRLFGLPIPPEVARSRRDPRVRLLEAMALHSLLASGDRELSSTRFGSTFMNLSHYLISDGWRYWRAELAYDVADVSRAPPPPYLRKLGFLGRLIGWASFHLRPRRDRR